MRTAQLKAYAKEAGKTIKEAEACWEKAKEKADKKFKMKDEHYWAYVSISTRWCLGIEQKRRAAEREEKKKKK